MSGLFSQNKNNQEMSNVSNHELSVALYYCYFRLMHLLIFRLFVYLVFFSDKLVARKNNALLAFCLRTK